MGKWMDEIQAHPLVVALVFFAVVFILYNVMKKPQTTATAPAGAPGLTTGAGVGGPTGSEVYASQLYQYPVYQAPVVNQNAPPVNPPVTTPIPSPPPPATTNVYHGILSVIGSPNPASIGPWIAGRKVSYAGGTYTLVPQSGNRLAGIDSKTGDQVLLWDGTGPHGVPATTGAYSVDAGLPAGGGFN